MSLKQQPRAWVQREYQEDLARGVIPPLPMWAGEAVNLITDRPAAGDLVTGLVAQAEEALSRAGKG
jgi:nitronate monooxygenase